MNSNTIWTIFQIQSFSDSINCRIFGELCAFPLDMREDELPDVSNYSNKYRAYGQLGDYQEKDEIYLFDVARNKFINAQRSTLSKMYTRYGCCNYCPCPRKGCLFELDLNLHRRFLTPANHCLLFFEQCNRHPRSFSTSSPSKTASSATWSWTTKARTTEETRRRFRFLWTQSNRTSRTLECMNNFRRWSRTDWRLITVDTSTDRRTSEVSRAST